MGSAAVRELDRAVFWKELIGIIGPQAGAYWQYLDDSLAREAAPSHLFHVLGVYPWTRLRATGRPEPLHVLDSCRITPALVLGETGQGTLEVECTELAYDPEPRRLSLAGPVRRTVDAPAFLLRSEHVAMHWGGVCDELTAAEAHGLEQDTAAQLDRLAPRLSMS